MHKCTRSPRFVISPGFAFVSRQAKALSTLPPRVKCANYSLEQKTLTPKQWEKEQANKSAAEKVLVNDAKAAADGDRDPEVKNA